MYTGVRSVRDMLEVCTRTRQKSLRSVYGIQLLRACRTVNRPWLALDAPRWKKLFDDRHERRSRLLTAGRLQIGSVWGLDVVQEVQS